MQHNSTCLWSFSQYSAPGGCGGLGAAPAALTLILYLGSGRAGFAFPGSPGAPALLRSLNLRQTNNLYYILDNKYQYVIMAMLNGTRTLSVAPKLMYLRRAVLEIPAKFSVPPGLPLNKKHSPRTHSESTLPQLLIPLHFISFICNVYSKPREGEGRPRPKGLQLVTIRFPIPRARTNARLPRAPWARGNPNPLYALLHNSRTPRGWDISGWDSQSWLSFLAASRGSPVTNHRPRVTEHESRSTSQGARATLPLVPRYRCAATRKVPESRQLLIFYGATPPGNISAPAGV